MFKRSVLRGFTAPRTLQPRLRAIHRHAPSGTQFTLYRVRFQKPAILTWRRVAIASLYGVPAYIGFSYGLPLIFGTDLEERETLTEDGFVDVEETEEEDTDDVLFIPLGWPKLREKTFYKGSDPEWQEFIKFSRNREKHKDVAQRLTAITRNMYARHPNSRQIFGSVNLRAGRFWLDMRFPAGPPRDYEVNGIGITDDAIFFGTKTISQEDYRRMRSSFIPSAALSASWATAKNQFSLQASRMKSFFESAVRQTAGTDTNDGASRTVEPQQSSMTRGAASASAPHRRGTPVAEKGGVTTPAADTAHSRTGTQQSKPDGAKIPDFPSQQPGGTGSVLSTFVKALSNDRRRARMDPPRGTVVITGLVEVVGTKAKVIVDVFAAYDPVSDEYVNCHWAIKSVVPRTQSPRG
ncbi:hypothetical protein EJ06DRAFT_527321 [Trichodelitschia bisporula]|uniref:Uncharacterized protein n=1 Tax=Trichodelitschia bisporula TaxID=703511 RepID=A0A6G1I6P7_9PEZI|nr:hypothetical protein EJ06DRAFT_527321 [Trichodelitschia bisporula]